MKNSVYKSKEGRDRFRAVYSQVLGQFPFEQQYVETAYGKTFMLSYGQPSNPPLVLLHGSCSNSAFWFPEIMALSAQYRVYAVDIIGEAGNSEEYRPDLNASDFALWLNDVLDALGIGKTVLVGNSLGGWMALKFSTTFPERVSRLILIAPSGLAPVRQGFIENVAQARQGDGTTPINADVIGEHSLPKEVLDFMNLIAASYDPIQELPVFPDDQLLQLNMPVLFIDGEEDVIIDAQKSAQRLSRLIPAQIELIPGGGHVVLNAMDFIGPFLLTSK